MKEFFQKHFLVFLGVVFTWLLFSAVIIFISHDVKDSLLNLGMFGDSFNIITSLFTGLAFAGVIISVRLQKEELKEVKQEFEEQTKALENQQKEMVIQSFDNKFFQMLNLFNNIINSFVYRENKSQYIFRDENGHIPPTEYNIFEKREVLVKVKNRLENIVDKCISIDSFQVEFNHANDVNLKLYFINLYQIIKYIDKKFGKAEYIEAKNYTNIVRAQLSKDELVLLFYNAIGVISFSGGSYKKLVEQYAFFEHLTYNDLNPNNDKIIVDILLKEYQVEAFGKNKELREKVLILKGSN